MKKNIEKGLPYQVSGLTKLEEWGGVDVGRDKWTNELGERALARPVYR